MLASSSGEGGWEEEGNLDMSDAAILLSLPLSLYEPFYRSSTAISFYLCPPWLGHGSYTQLNAVSRTQTSL